MNIVISDYAIDAIISYLNSEIKHVKITNNSNVVIQTIDVSTETSEVVEILTDYSENLILVKIHLKGEYFTEAQLLSGAVNIKKIEVYDENMESNPPMLQSSYVHPLQLISNEDEVIVNINISKS